MSLKGFVLAAMLAAPAVASAQTSSIASNFNGTSIPAGSDIWFNAVFSLSPSSTSGTIRFVGSSIQFTSGSTSYNVAVPDAIISFSASTTVATTTYDSGSNSWVTMLPLQSSLSGSVFLSGVNLSLPSGLSGGVNPVTWSGTFLSSVPGVEVNWKWAAAAYSDFSSDLALLGVKPVDDNDASSYLNSDHAGTPESYKLDVIGGARGGGGSNFTGSYSGSAKVRIVSVPEPSMTLLMAPGLLLLGLVAVRRRREG